jgi:NAD-dependent dihydropyrimidine dehydrogenase PreA subunit
MRNLRYLPAVVTLRLDGERCIGCGICCEVCPQGVFGLENQKAVLVDRDGCMECGACAQNCPVEAISVNPGVGCAAYIIQTWIKGRKGPGCGGTSCC